MPSPADYEVTEAKGREQWRRLHESLPPQASFGETRDWLPVERVSAPIGSVWHGELLAAWYRVQTLWARVRGTQVCIVALAMAVVLGVVWSFEGRMGW